MDRLHAAWWISTLPRGTAIAAAVVLGAVVAGTGLSVAIGSIRGADSTAAQPSAGVEVLVSQPSATAEAPDAERATMTPSPMGDPSATPSASATPTPDVETSAMPTVLPATPPATPAATPPAMPAETPVPPNPAELACENFEFASADSTVSTLAELQAGMTGTWAGCVTTPWVPPYWVTITFAADGTYRSVALSGSEQPALYYGTDDDSSEKRYALDDLHDDGEGIGHIDIVFWAGNTNRGDLRNVRLMDDRLQFEFFHRGEYGPLIYQLHRTDPSD